VTFLFHVKHYCPSAAVLGYGGRMAKPSPPRSGRPRTALSIGGAADFAATFDVAPETVARLETYAALLRHWQKAVNLVAMSTLDAVWQRHFADSAQLLPLAPEARRWVDLGSGAGFPGLVIAILLAEGAPAKPAETPPEAPAAGAAPRVTLVESDGRKGAFLRAVAREVGVAVDILSTRIESVATQSRVAAPDVVTARALAPLDKLLSLAAPLWSPRTVGLFLKGREPAAEVEAALKAWTFQCELIPSSTEAGAHIVRVSTLKPNRKEPRS
jgi:16S rRNA (guanine527-N7)-methyltransferase